MEIDDVGQALVLWLGFGRAAWPQRDDQAVVAVLGADRANPVLKTLRDLESDFYGTDAPMEADLVKMSDRAARQFRARHPEVSEEGVKALRWAYMFDYK